LDFFDGFFGTVFAELPHQFAIKTVKVAVFAETVVNAVGADE